MKQLQAANWTTFLRAEIDEGWLVFTHGVGMIRGYCIGACLLDKDDPSRVLKRTPSPWGGSYASRIHIYLAPGTSTSIAAGRGPFRTRGRDGKNHFRNYAWAMQAANRGADVMEVLRDAVAWFSTSLSGYLTVYALELAMLLVTLLVLPPLLRRFSAPFCARG